MGSHPTHQDVITSLAILCGDSIAECEAGLKAQYEADIAARKEMEKVQEKARFAKKAAKKAAEEAAQLASKHAKKESVRFKEMVTSQDVGDVTSQLCFEV
jgi:hypothetical protein